MDFHVSRSGAKWISQNGRKSTQNHTRPTEKEGLHSLSQEERDCIKFLEETIDSADHDLDYTDEKRFAGGSNPAVSRSSTDIIDLVQMQPKEATYTPQLPDFRSMPMNPETHFEMRSRRDPLENLPYDAKLPPSLTHATANENHNSTSQASHQPPGLVPTPVIIAQKIAEHQRAVGITSSSTILANHQRNFDSAPQDHPVKQSPSTTEQPSHYPRNINVIVRNKDSLHSDPIPPINVQERKVQVLTHLTDPLQLEEVAARNNPIRHASYQGPDTDRSRMEALSKLGLNVDQPSTSSSYKPVSAPTTSRNKIESLLSKSFTEKHQTVPVSLASSAKPNFSTTDVNNFGDKSTIPSIRSSSMREPQSNYIVTHDSASHLPVNSSTKNDISPKMLLPSSMKSKPTPNHHNIYQNRPSAAPPSSGVIGAKSDVSINSFGGKSRVMISGSTVKTEAASEYKIRSDVAGREESKVGVTNNSYGGKSKVMNPSLLSTPMPETSPDRISSHNLKPGAPPEDLSSDFNSYGRKSKVVSPSGMSIDRSEVSANIQNQNSPVTTPKPVQAPPTASPGTSASQTELPLPPPPPPPLSDARGHGATAELHPSPGEHRMPISKPKVSFRPQGVTVQFSGSGPTDASRREALRSLGLLKKTSAFSSTHSGKI